ncbi:MAG: Rieske (2Fe-2S) protein [Acidimicrobiales bacterium]
MPSQARPRVWLQRDDRLVRTLGQRLQADVVVGEGFDVGCVEGDIGLVVVAVDTKGAVDFVSQVKAARPQVIVAAHTFTPDREVWETAERAGADVVVNSGALVKTLAAMLASLGASELRKKRWALCDASEIAGRLGLIATCEDTPVGPVAVFNLDSKLVAVADRCPHAGARLSEGGYEAGLITCPAHGSQFEARTGRRARGPADCAIDVFDVVSDSGRVWLLWV